jgi:hypothetical protein
MSRLVWYDNIPGPYDDQGKNLPIAVKNSYYEFRTRAYRLFGKNGGLPNELWNEILKILFILCAPIQTPVPVNKIFEWFDNYIHSPEQHRLNPVFINTTGNHIITTSLLERTELSLSLYSIRLNPGPIKELSIPGYGDLVYRIYYKWCTCIGYTTEF